MHRTVPSRVALVCFVLLGAACPPPTHVVVSPGTYFTCAVREDGTTRCWGKNDKGELGDGTTGGSRSHPAAVTGLGAAQGIIAGTAHGCAVLKTGSAYCWGDNGAGELGAAGSTVGFSATPLKVGFAPAGPHSVTTLPDVASLAAGDAHTCAALSNGEVWCWGSNDLAQLGDPSFAGSKARQPNLVPGLWVQGVSGHPPPARKLAAAGQFTCALLEDGHVWCWGLNNRGQLGRGSTGSFSKGEPPAQVSGLSNGVAIAAGHDQACAVSTGEVKCWGYNQIGLGNAGHSQTSNVPVTIAGLTAVTDVAVGAMHGCAIKHDGSVWCWGDDSMGQLGSGRDPNRGQAPKAVAGLSDAVRIAAGQFNTCVVERDGTVWCWGWNTDGQLGRPNPSASDPIGDRPAKVPGL
jgi:alpha-tubulin suppressor-like RCC1 family protein